MDLTNQPGFIIMNEQFCNRIQVVIMGIVIVEICDSNLMSALELEGLEELYPEVAVLRADCMNLCGLCKLRPYALVNGKRVVGQSTEECVEKIKEAIQAELAVYFEN